MFLIHHQNKLWGHFFESFGNVLGFIFFLPSLLFIRAHISDIKICLNHMLLNEFLSSPFSYRPADEMERKTPKPCVVLWVICVSPTAKPVWQVSLLTFPVFIMAKLKPSPRVLLWQHVIEIWSQGGFTFHVAFLNAQAPANLKQF